MVVPYRYRGEGGGEIRGTIRVLLDLVEGRPSRMALLARDAQGEGWAFDVRGLDAPRCCVYTGSERAREAARPHLAELRSIFHNMGGGIDDTIEDEGLFDGFGGAQDDGPCSEARVVDTRV